MYAEKETMGSVEVYDYKKMQWGPNVPDFKKRINHFEDISTGRVRPDYKGWYIVGSGNQHRAEPPSKELHPIAQLVTPVAQAIEMAKSELKREHDDTPKKSKSIRMQQMYPLPEKRTRHSKVRPKRQKLGTQYDE